MPTGRRNPEPSFWWGSLFFWRRYKMAAHNFIDLTGQRFGHLVVIKEAERNKDNRVMWKCKCDCGNITIVMRSNLRGGASKSCGCLRGRASKHGACRNRKETRLYRVWGCMKERCHNPNKDNYHSYGGRGISVCAEWYNDFIAFKKWAVAHNYKDNLQIDRKNNDGNYEPSNCRFVTPAINTQRQKQVKLTRRKVLVIKQLLKKTKLTHKKIAGLFNVCRVTIGQISDGSHWRNVTKLDWKTKQENV
jgi:hypothetical protein